MTICILRAIKLWLIDYVERLAFLQFAFECGWIWLERMTAAAADGSVGSVTSGFFPENNARSEKDGPDFSHAAQITQVVDDVAHRGGNVGKRNVGVGPEGAIVDILRYTRRILLVTAYLTSRTEPLGDEKLIYLARSTSAIFR